METVLAESLSWLPVLVRRTAGEILCWTAGCEDLYGYSPAEAVGRSSHDLLRTVFPQPLEAVEAQLRDGGAWRGRLRHTTKTGREIWTESVWRLRPIANGDEPVVVEHNTDITEAVALEQRRLWLSRELDHRVKNTLAVVQGLARMGISNAAERKRFEDRLVALSEAHKLLSERHWEQAQLHRVLQEVVRALGVEDRVSLRGPDVPLSANTAVAYALAIHELSTNALKHGALSRPQGRVKASWRLTGEAADTLHFSWRETGGPPATPPTRRGFGTRLIRQAVAMAHGAGDAVRLDFTPRGLVCEFEAVLDQAADQDPGDEAAAEPQPTPALG